MPTPESSIFEIGFDGAVGPDQPVEVPIPRGGELELRDFTGDVWVRLNNTSAERRPARAGETLCYQEGLVTKVLLDNGGGDGGSVELEVRKGFTVRGFGGSEIKRKLPQPARLAGDLEAGTTLQDGERADEEVDTSDTGDTLRLRARVDGHGTLTSLQELVDASNLAEAVTAVADPERGHVYVGCTDGTLAVVNAVEPSAMTVRSTVAPGGISGGIFQVAYDAESQKVLAIGDDTTDKVLGVFDVSDLDAPALEGDVALVSGETFLGVPDVQIGVHQAGTAVYVGGVDLDSGGNDLYIAEYSTATAPTLVGTIANSGLVVAHSEALELLVAAGDPSGSTEVLLFSTASPTSPSARGTIVTVGENGSDGPAFERVSPAIDDERELVVGWMQAAGQNNLVVLDVADPLDPVQLSTTSVNFTPVAGLMADTVRAQFVVVESSNIRVYNWSSPSEGVSQVASVAEVHDTRGATYDPGTRTVFGVDFSDNSIASYGVRTGGVVLRAFPLLTTGERAETGAPSPVTLDDGVEVLVDVPLNGEGGVDVEVENSSGESTAIAFVEQYRR